MCNYMERKTVLNVFVRTIVQHNYGSQSAHIFIQYDFGSKLTRWRLKLEEYQYKIHYKPGINNTNTDALSRIHQNTYYNKSGNVSREKIH